MGEREAIEQVESPVTVQRIVDSLRELGIRGGETVLVHSSLSALGWVSGGAQAVIRALQRAVTADGTLLMPMHTGQYTDPADWENPPIPEEWVETVRESRPAYDPERTPSRNVGTIPETFRSYPDVHRSDHPLYSFGVWGADAEAIASRHDLDFGLGPASPLGSVYERDGFVLLLGTPHSHNTSLHLAEYLANIETPEKTIEVPLRREGERVTVEMRDIELSVEGFDELGEAFEKRDGSRVGSVGAAEAKLHRQRRLVDFATNWLQTNR